MRAYLRSVVFSFATAGYVGCFASSLHDGDAATGARHPLLVIEQQRATLVQRIVTEWAAEFAAQPAGDRTTGRGRCQGALTDERTGPRSIIRCRLIWSYQIEKDRRGRQAVSTGVAQGEIQ